MVEPVIFIVAPATVSVGFFVVGEFVAATLFVTITASVTVFPVWLADRSSRLNSRGVLNLWTTV